LEWAAPAFIIPKKDEGFQYGTSLDLNIGYYCIELNPDAKKHFAPLCYVGANMSIKGFLRGCVIAQIPSRKRWEDSWLI